MAAEAKRGCGYRKVGGLYLVGTGTGAPCCKLPIPLTVCPTCGHGIKQARGWTWIDPKPFLAQDCTRSHFCVLRHPEELGERVGLLWIGGLFYRTPDIFMREAQLQGISRRIKRVPRGFEIGKSWIFLAHPFAYPSTELVEIEPPAFNLPQVMGTATVWKPGIFHIFKPFALEKVVTASEAKDEEAMKALRDKGITPFIVADDDLDHRGSAYDPDDDAAELQLEDDDEQAETTP